MYTDVFVGVSKGDVELKVILERVGGVDEIELCE